MNDRPCDERGRDHHNRRAEGGHIREDTVPKLPIGMGTGTGLLGGLEMGLLGLE